MPHTDFHSYEPAVGHGLKHDPFNAIVGPRPIGWISSIDAEGRVNLAPYSFFNAFNYTPPIIGFSSIGWKDTVANIRATDEFVWNLTDHSLVEQMNVTSAAVPHDICEFDLAHLARLPSDLVRPPRVAASPVQFECRMTQMVQLQTAQGKTVESWVTFGEVVRVHIRRNLVAEGTYDTAAARPILRAGGLGDYAAIQPQDMFEILRPQGAQTLERLIRDSRASPG
ncbi:flavin reductase family protein [Acetobacter senegalensis]|uniref:flavin reductase family protein n=1 Tax=Acetobacter senegalensis TaxID=446692 RepID=UPI001EE01BEE